MAGHVFISYSRTDGAYVGALVAHLKAAGIPVWIDTNLDYGQRWASVVRQHVDTCAAFVPVMTPDAEASEWVEREITRANSENRPIIPLLLSGKPFFHLANVQYEDVTGGRMPSTDFVTRLRVLTQAAGAPVTAAAPGGEPVTRSISPAPPSPASPPAYASPPAQAVWQPAPPPVLSPPPAQPAPLARPRPPSGTNSLALTSLILSLVGLASVITAPIGAIMGHMARKKIRQTGEQGDGLARAGVIVGWSVTGLYTLLCCGSAFLTAGEAGYY